MLWQPEAYRRLLNNDYPAVVDFYEQSIAVAPDTISHYWYLGLGYLLSGKAELAQATWLSALSQGTPEEVHQWSTDLQQILETEAQRQESLQNYRLCWLVRNQIRELAPQDINNLLQLVRLQIILQDFSPKLLGQWQIIESLQQSRVEALDLGLLAEVLAALLAFPTRATLAFAEVSADYLAPQVWLPLLRTKALQAAYQKGMPIFAADLTKLALKLQPHRLYLLKDLFGFSLYGKDYQQALSTAHQFYALSNTVSLQLFGNYQILQALLSAGNWEQVHPIAQRHRDLLTQVIQAQPQLEPVVSQSLLAVGSPWLYLQDDLAENRHFLNQVAQLFQQQFGSDSSLSAQTIRNQSRPLRIGYIAHTLKKHSVGWLSRWLFRYHNRQEFQITIYLINQQEDQLTQNWFRSNADLFYNLEPKAQVIADQIRTDQIDILVDLDSITLDLTCQVLALKPAPVQVTWLGLDASGLPTVDYFLADPYVLPENAQEHYQEKIWRLPQTYLAVDGFEVGVPTLRREDLQIPQDAIIYLSAQNGFKRHPDTVRWQMQILSSVPNSYFLIKGVGDDQTIQHFFNQIAQAEKVNPDRLRFLPRDHREQIHRANLQIADVVLDTYPYNGATTTLETLWMGIPLVTRVGQQFAARNSYTFMMNAGVTEGIAWTEPEYIEWGVQFGQSQELRRDVAWKLRQSRQTSSLWNAKQFTQEMEKAYQQMWKRYLYS